MAEEVSSMPVLYLGQSSHSIGVEMDKLNHIFGGVCSPSSTYINDEIVAGKSNDNNVFRMQKCAHILTEQTLYCSVCSQNSELLQEVVLRRLLESKSSSYCGNQICIVSDNYTQFGAWSSSIVMEYLQQETSYGKNNHAGMDLINKSASSGGIICVLVKPPMGCSRGLENMYSLLSTQHLLQTAHATLFRDSATMRMVSWSFVTCFNILFHSFLLVVYISWWVPFTIILKLFPD